MCEIVDDENTLQHPVFVLKNRFFVCFVLSKKYLCVVCVLYIQADSRRWRRAKKKNREKSETDHKSVACVIYSEEKESKKISKQKKGEGRKDDKQTQEERSKQNKKPVTVKKCKLIC